MEAQHAIIKRLEIKGLWGKQDFTFDFHDDLNIFTGSNGSGKTTILKVLWYAVSGNIHQLWTELASFKYIKITLESKYRDIIELETIISEKNQFTKRFNKHLEGALISSGEYLPEGTKIYKTKINRNSFDSTYSYTAEDISIAIEPLNVDELNPLDFIFKSIYFPTFRRVEYEFSKNENYKFDIKEGFKEFSYKFSHKNHEMVSFSGVEDLKNKINTISSDIRAKLEPLEKDFNTFIAVNSTTLDPQLFTTQLNERLAEKQRQEAIITRPLTTFSRLIDELMLEKSVQVTDDLILGTHPNRVRLEDLSGGEKNLLSFMVYAMTQPAMMFIDEPELGMHVDWQRKFVEIMQAISPQTQYFIATHSAAVRVAYAENKFFLDDQIN